MLNKLRNLFLQENIQGYIIPSSDEFQNEFIPENNNRLKFITNFSGSNGLAIVLADKCMFFTDGRYLEQASKQLDLNVFTVLDIATIRRFDWARYINTSDAIGYDPLLFTQKQLEIFKPLNIKPIQNNLVDLLIPQLKIEQNTTLYSLEYSGQDAAEKIAKLRLQLNVNSNKSLGYLITDTSSICWLLNIRNQDQSCIGMVNCYLIVTNTEILLFADIKVITELTNYFENLGMKVLPTSQIQQFLQSIATKPIFIDESTCPIAFSSILPNGQHNNSYKLLQACKNPQELTNFIQVHINDAVVICEFLAWLDNVLDTQNISEFDLSNKLINLRKNHQSYIKESFHAICGYQENSSVIHYRPLKATAKQISGSGMLLVDTGGHYYGGTTDITRTIFLGTPSSEEKKFYTLVLKGHINLAKIKFKKGCSGQNLDVLARMHLWQHLEDYPHSTGHGVGNFLNVHEGPEAINLSNNVVLQPGMVLSNEPGYYKPGAFGIRIENLMYVKETINSNFLEFEALTLVPYCAKLIDHTLLDDDEKAWLANYYVTIKDKIYNLLSKNAQSWLERELCAINS